MGLQSENRVIQKMTSDGWNLIFQRARTQIAEIDLIFEKDNTIELIEVKKLDQAWRAFQRINQKQIHKLLQNQNYFSQVYKHKIFKAKICWVLTTDIQFVEISG